MVVHIQAASSLECRAWASRIAEVIGQLGNREAVQAAVNSLRDAHAAARAVAPTPEPEKPFDRSQAYFLPTPEANAGAGAEALIRVAPLPPSSDDEAGEDGSEDDADSVTSDEGASDVAEDVEAARISHAGFMARIEAGLQESLALADVALTTAAASQAGTFTHPAPEANLAQLEAQMRSVAAQDDVADAPADDVDTDDIIDGLTESADQCVQAALSEARTILAAPMHDGDDEGTLETTVEPDCGDVEGEDNTEQEQQQQQQQQHQQPSGPLNSVAELSRDSSLSDASVVSEAPSVTAQAQATSPVANGCTEADAGSGSDDAADSGAGEQKGVEGDDMDGDDAATAPATPASRSPQGRVDGQDNDGAEEDTPTRVARLRYLNAVVSPQATSPRTPASHAALAACAAMNPAVFTPELLRDMADAGHFSDDESDGGDSFNGESEGEDDDLYEVGSTPCGDGDVGCGFRRVRLAAGSFASPGTPGTPVGMATPATPATGASGLSNMTYRSGGEERRLNLVVKGVRVPCAPTNDDEPATKLILGLKIVGRGNQVFVSALHRSRHAQGEAWCDVVPGSSPVLTRVRVYVCMCVATQFPAETPRRLAQPPRPTSGSMTPPWSTHSLAAALRPSPPRNGEHASPRRSHHDA